MQPFRFTLDKLMRYRELLAGNILNHFVQAQNQQVLEQQHLEEMTQQMQRCREGTTSGTVAGYFQFGLFWEDLQQRLHDQRGKLQQADEQVAKLRDELASAKQRCQVLDKLRDRCWQEYQCESQRELQNQGDEMVLLRFQQRR